MSKFIIRLLRHSKQVNREEDGGVHYDQVFDECKKKLSDDTGFGQRNEEAIRQCSVLVNFVNAPYWSIEKWMSFLAKGGGQKQRFQYCVKPNYTQKFLYRRAIQGHSGSTIHPASHDNVLLPEDTE